MAVFRLDLGPSNWYLFVANLRKRDGMMKIGTITLSRGGQGQVKQEQTLNEGNCEFTDPSCLWCSCPVLMRRSERAGIALPRLSINSSTIQPELR